MNRTTARLAVTVAGVGALTGLAVGAAHADESGSPSASPDSAKASEGPTPNYVLQDAPGLPIGDPVSSVFSVAAPAYGVLGALG
jgi:hypothetical protein